MLLQPGLQQLVLHGHAAQQFAVGKRPAIVAAIGGTKHLAHLQSATRAYDRRGCAADSEPRSTARKPPYLAHRPDAN